MTNHELITKLAQLFESQRFLDWVSDNGRFGKYLSGDLTAEGMDPLDQIKMIRRDIANFLEIEDK